MSKKPTSLPLFSESYARVRLECRNCPAVARYSVSGWESLGDLFRKAEADGWRWLGPEHPKWKLCPKCAKRRRLSP